MWEMEFLILSILLIGVNIGFVVGILKYKSFSLIYSIAVLVDVIIIVLILTFLNIGEYIVAYEPYSPLNPIDVGLECVELAGFLAIFCAAFIARAKYPVIGGKGWNILLFAVVLGSIGMFFDIYGEFLNFAGEFFPIYKFVTGAFQIAGIAGLAFAFLMFYKFSEILFTPSPKKD